MGSAGAVCIPVPRSSNAVTRWSGDGAEVRCAVCAKLLFKVKPSPDSGLIIERVCRGLLLGVTCGRLNHVCVTGHPGRPLAATLPETWRCAQCDGQLGKVHSVKGRIAVKCRCGAKVAVTAADAIETALPAARVG